jgi:hypothetical protein
MRKANLAFLAVFFISLCYAQEPSQQRWIPKRIVGMDYPLIARSARIEGKVEIACVLNPDGTVASTKPIGNPHPILLKAVQENASKWVFMKESNADRSPGTATLIYLFQMGGKSAHSPNRQFEFEYPSSIFLTSEYCQMEDSCY